MTTTEVGGIAADQLRQHLEAIERLSEEKAGIQADIRDRFQLAKSQGFDPKVMRQVLKLRQMEKADRQEMEHLLALYSRAVGMAE